VGRLRHGNVVGGTGAATATVNGADASRRGVCSCLLLLPADVDGTLIHSGVQCTHTDARPGSTCLPQALKCWVPPAALQLLADGLPCPRHPSLVAAMQLALCAPPLPAVGQRANFLHKQSFIAAFKQVFDLDTDIDVVKHHGRWGHHSGKRKPSASPAQSLTVPKPPKACSQPKLGATAWPSAAQRCPAEELSSRVAHCLLY
jgi:hypothetical protein